MNIEFYKKEIEKIAKLADEELYEFKDVKNRLDAKYRDNAKHNLKDAGKMYAGAIGAVGGATLARNSRRDGALDGIVRRYHNTEAKNVDGIKSEGIKSSKALDHDNLTSRAAGISKAEQEGKTYLARKRRAARSVGAKREQLTSGDILGMKGEADHLRNSFKTQKTLKVNIPLKEYRKLNRVANPELKGATNAKEVYENIIKPNILHNSGNKKTDMKKAKAYFDSLGVNTDTIQGDIASKFIKGGKGYQKNTLKNIAKHIKENPKMFGKGVAQAGLGLGLAGGGAYAAGKGYKDIFVRNKKFRKDNKEDLARQNELAIKYLRG